MVLKIKLLWALYSFLTILSSNIWTQDVFLFLCVFFKCFHLWLMVFIVEIFHLYLQLFRNILFLWLLKMGLLSWFVFQIICYWGLTYWGGSHQAPPHTREAASDTHAEWVKFTRAEVTAWCQASLETVGMLHGGCTHWASSSNVCGSRRHTPRRPLLLILYS